MPNVRDHDASVYLRLQGDALSVGGYEQNPIFWDKVIRHIAMTTTIEAPIGRPAIIIKTGYQFCTHKFKKQEAF